MRAELCLALAMAAALKGAVAEDHRAAVALAAQAPLAFERATGNGRWVARGSGYSLGIGAADIDIGLGNERLRIRFVGANATAASEGLDPLPGKVNFFLGSDPQRWLHDIPTWGRVRYSGVYPGIDAIWYGNQGRLEYDLLLQPGADTSKIAMKFEGARKISVEAGGDLRVEMAGGALALKLPQVYQEGGGGRQRVGATYELRAGDEVGFRVGAYDKSRPLVIDPTLVYATYFGSLQSLIAAVAVDSLGNVYIGGTAQNSTVLPVVNAVQSGNLGVYNAFVSKFDPTGKTILYSTYLGGSGSDYLNGIAVDSGGNVVGAGQAQSGFPTVNATQATFNGPAGGFAGFAFKLNATGNALVYSTYLGGSATNTSGIANGVAVDALGNAYITGYEYSSGFPATALNNCTHSYAYCTFVEKLSAPGANVYSALINADWGQAIAVDAQGAAYVAGYSGYHTFPNNPPGAQPINVGGYDAFVFKLSADAGSLVWATFLGGHGFDNATAIAVGSGGVVYFGGQTASADLPVTAGVVQGTYGGETDAFVASISADGTRFGFVTYLGGGRTEDLSSLAVAPGGQVVVAGTTDSRDFPVSAALQPAFPGSPYSFFKTTNSGATFTGAENGSLPGFNGHYSTSGTILPDPSNPGTIVVDTGQGVFRTADDGATWASVEAISKGSSARSLSNPSVIYTLDPCLLFKSSDGGRTFVTANSNVCGGPTWFLVGVSPTDPNTVLLFGSSAVSRSTDGGATFPQTTTLPAGGGLGYLASSVVASPDGSLYLAGYSVYKSTDGGLTWNALALPQITWSNSAYAFTLSTSSPSILYASDGTNIYKSTNAGAAWNTVAAGVSVTGLAADPTNPQNLYATGAAGIGVLTSTDGGVTWPSSPAPLDVSELLLIAANPSNPAEVYLGNYVPTSAFVAKLSADGKSLNWSTYYGSHEGASSTAAAVAPSGDVWIAGVTAGGSLPLTPDAQNTNVDAWGPGFLARIADATASCSYTVTPTAQYLYPGSRTLLLGPGFLPFVGQDAFSVTAPSGCAWTANASDAWIHVLRNSGTGSGPIPLFVDPNQTASTRTGTVSVNSQTFTIVQPPPSCTYSLSSPPTLTSAGGTATITVTAPAGCPWDVEWGTTGEPLPVTSATTGTGNGTVTISVPPNFSTASLSWGVYIGRGFASISESGAAIACTYSLGATTASAGAAGGNASFTVTPSSSACAWTATSNASWITVTGGSSGTGAGTVTYSVAATTSGNQRSGAITVGSTAFTVTEQGVAATFSLNPASASAAAAAGAGTVGVVCNLSDAAWTASSNSTWLTIASGASGTGRGSVGYSVAANNSVSSRSGSLTIAGLTFPVTQSGAAPVFSLNPSSVSVGAAAASGTVAITGTPPDAPWSATSNASFIKVVSGSSGTGSGSTGYSIAANTTTGSRVGTITVAGQTFTVTQAGALPATLSLTKTHAGAFAPSLQGATYTVTVSNAPGTVATTGTVTVTENPPAGLTLVSMSGDNWSCAGNTCSRGDSLAAGASYDAITVTVNVPSTTTSQVTNQVSVSGGGSLPASASDPTYIGGLQFYPLTPCRVADTRTGAGFTGTQGPPYLAGGTARGFQVAGLCGVPANATAYSLNVTVVPRTSELGFLTTWPTGQTQPLASTLNSPAGEVVANAALVPAGTNGNISIYASDPTDVLFDINGYFAPPSASGLQFYPLTPCRVADTRVGTGFTGSQGPPYLAGGTSRNFQVAGLCGVPSTAAAYSLNVTVVPRAAALGYLTTWPTGQTQPWASTLNSPAGAVVANASLVPAGTSGEIGIYASDATDVLFDINGYFAPAGTGGLDYYTMTPCRVADTRSWAGFPGQFGPPSMGTATSRSFPVQSSVCNVPSVAAAYSFNVTVVPSAGALGYLTTWPTGQPQPWASTLNSPDGLVVANAALVPAGTAGAISIYVSNPTDVLFDISGYFAPGQ